MPTVVLKFVTSDGGLRARPTGASKRQNVDGIQRRRTDTQLQ